MGFHETRRADAITATGLDAYFNRKAVLRCRFAAETASSDYRFTSWLYGGSRGEPSQNRRLEREGRVRWWRSSRLLISAFR